MKFLLSGDWHLTDNPPEKYQGDFWKDLNETVDFILKIFVDLKCDYICQPGDMFNHFRQSDFVKQHFIDKFRKIQKKSPLILTVLGQHDQRWHSTIDIKNIPSAVIESSGVSQVLHATDSLPFSIYDSETDQTFVIYGCGFKEEDKLNPLVKGDFNILLTHRLVLESIDQEWQSKKAVTAKALLSSNNFDLIVSGDNHKAFDCEYDGKTLVNCGSLMRTRIDQEDHVPRIYVFDSKEMFIERIDIPVRNFRTIFDVATERAEQEKSDELKAFVTTVGENTKFVGMDFKKNLDEVAEKPELHPITSQMIKETIYAVQK